MNKNKAIFSIFIVIVVISVISIIGYILYDLKKDRNIRIENEIRPIKQQALDLENHKLYLKEMNNVNLINGKISGSFLLISGSVYGSVNENQYLNIVYFDDENITNPKKDTGVYRITKFSLESLEIITIPVNETPYFKYVNNGYEYCYLGETCQYKLKIGTPRLFLPDGWMILNNN